MGPGPAGRGQGGLRRLTRAGELAAGAELRLQRIDVLATALWNNMTVEAVGGMDLSYAPPFSPVWDPVLLAAGKAASKI